MNAHLTAGEIAHGKKVIGRLDFMRSLNQIKIIGLCLITVVVSGCGGKTEDAPTTQVDGNTAPAQADTTNEGASQSTGAGSNATATASVAAPQVDPDRKETKWIGTIPYDVFYDQPLLIAADSTVIGGSEPVSAAVPTGTSPEMSPAAPAEAPAASGSDGASGIAVNWGEIIPMPVLIEELKSIRTRLTSNLQTVATYNRSAEAIALDGAMVAAMGAIVTAHPEADVWKERGKFIRDLGYEIYSNSGESGRSAYTATEEPFIKLQTALDGGTVDGLESEDVVPFGDVVYVADMMKRIETSFNNLKANINTEARMKEAPAAVEQDLRVLAALGTMMGTESYDNADAKQYQSYVTTFVNGAMTGVNAVKAEDFEGFREGLNQIQTTCAECHQQYRGSDSGF